MNQPTPWWRKLRPASAPAPGTHPLITTAPADMGTTLQVRALDPHGQPAPESPPPGLLDLSWPPLCMWQDPTTGAPCRSPGTWATWRGGGPGDLGDGGPVVRCCPEHLADLLAGPDDGATQIAAVRDAATGYTAADHDEAVAHQDALHRLAVALATMSLDASTFIAPPRAAPSDAEGAAARARSVQDRLDVVDTLTREASARAAWADPGAPRSPGQDRPGPISTRDISTRDIFTDAEGFLHVGHGEGSHPVPIHDSTTERLAPAPDDGAGDQARRSGAPLPEEDLGLPPGAHIAARYRPGAGPRGEDTP